MQASFLLDSDSLNLFFFFLIWQACFHYHKMLYICCPWLYLWTPTSQYITDTWQLCIPVCQILPLPHRPCSGKNVADPRASHSGSPQCWGCVCTEPDPWDRRRPRSSHKDHLRVTVGRTRYFLKQLVKLNGTLSRDSISVIQRETWFSKLVW